MDNNRRLEILGILTLALSVFFLISIFGYNPSEEPTLSPNIKPENPMGFFGIFVAHYLIKQWFGFASIIIPLSRRRRKQCRECSPIRKVPTEIPVESFQKRLHSLHRLHQ